MGEMRDRCGHARCREEPMYRVSDATGFTLLSCPECLPGAQKAVGRSQVTTRIRRDGNGRMLPPEKPERPR